jgi:positive regulator of sigma E activity
VLGAVNNFIYDGCMPNGKPKEGESLADLFPDITMQWHPKLNGDLRPSDFVPGSHKKVWWKCELGPDHEWQAEVRERAQGLGCTCCSGKKVSVTNSLETLFPDIAAQWHPSLNDGLKPSEVVAGSAKKVWWKCELGPDHEWLANPVHRTRANPTNCPACAGHMVSVTNSLTSLHPELASQWHPTLNGDLKPSEVVSGTPKKVWWKCELGTDHEWQAQVRRRTQGSGCPCCSGRKVSVTNSLTSLHPELALEWHPTLNGDLKPSEVVSGTPKKVWWKCEMGPDHEWKASPHTRISMKSGCSACAGRTVSVTNSLTSLHPELALEWHPTLNGDLKPSEFTAGSGKKVWWKCDKGPDHEWKSSPQTRRGAIPTGCPACAGHMVSVTNSLASIKPELAKQWHPTLNGDLTPDQVVAWGKTKYWWKCDKGPDHEWQAPTETGCAYCRGFKVSVTNNLAALFPDIAAQWHPSLNDGLKPSEVVAGSNKNGWWKCEMGPEHEWRATTSSRTLSGAGCPFCTLTPRSAQEIRLANELSALINFDLETHKVRIKGRARDVDIVLEDLDIVVEFDGSYWHRSKADKDLEKVQKLEAEGWNVIRVRERPLDSIHKNDVMVATNAPVKKVADLVLQRITEVTGVKIPKLKEYLASDQPWREKEALSAIREYQAENARKKAELAARRAAKKKT